MYTYIRFLDCRPIAKTVPPFQKSAYTYLILFQALLSQYSIYFFVPPSLHLLFLQILRGFYYCLLSLIISPSIPLTNSPSILPSSVSSSISQSIPPLSILHPFLHIFFQIFLHQFLLIFLRLSDYLRSYLHLFLNLFLHLIVHLFLHLFLYLFLHNILPFPFLI